MKSTQMYMSASFKQAMGNIVDANSNNLFEIRCKMMVDNQSSGTTDIIDIPPFDINSLSIEEDFYNNYRDVILMNIDLTEQDYDVITKNPQNIRTSITVVKKHNDGSTTLVATKNYMALLEDQTASTFSDINSLNTDTDEGVADDQRPVAFELIERIAYHANKKRINFILNKSTIEAALMFSAKLFGFEQVFIVPPDNTKEYTNIVIPPLKGLEELLDYLQGYSAYGIYSAGINHYIKDGTLYILPLYKSNLDEYQFNIYNGGSGAFAGSDNYHMFTNEGVDIIVPDGATVIGMSQAMVENVGNAYILNTPLKHIGQTGKLIADDTFDVDREFITNITSPSNNAGVTKNAYTQSYVLSDNVFNVHSDITAMKVIKINGVWPHAYPFMTHPAVCVGYHYDSGNRINTLKGWCDYIKYEFNRGNSMVGNLMTCVATFSISVIE